MIDSPPEPPARSPRFTVAWAVFSLVSFLVLGGTAQLLQLAWGLWVSEVILFAGLAVVGLQLAGEQPLRALGLHRFDARWFGFGFAAGLLNYVGWAVPLMALAQAVFPKALVDQFSSAQIFERATPLELGLVLAGVSLAAPLGEELFFRGFLQRGLSRHQGAPRAIVVTAFIFSAFHLDPVGLTARFELGVLFGLLAWRAGSLWPAIAAHAANNVFSSVLFLAAGEGSDEDLVWWVPLTMFLVGNAALVALVAWAGPRLQPAAPVEPEVVAPSPNVARLLLPWVVAGGIAVAALLALDWRGVRLNLLDAQLQPGKELRRRDDVKTLRARVRSGEADFADYEAMLKALKLR